MSELLLDAAGRRRSPATMPGFHMGRPPRNKGVRYPADPPTVEEIVAVMRAARSGPHGFRLRGLIAVLWRAGLRKGGRRREVGMDEWAWEQLQPWLQTRAELSVGPLFCVVNRPDARAAVVVRSG
jgi:hypothetical protein